MGHYSDYKIEIHKTTDDVFIVSDFRTVFREVTKYGLSSKFDLSNVKWYNNNSDMITISKLFPKCIFTLRRLSEDSDEWSVTKFIDGISNKEV